MLTDALANLKSLTLSLFNRNQTDHADDLSEPSVLETEETDHLCLPTSPLPDTESLIQIFKKAECCELDGLNEYDDDFTAFSPLGNLITHEMKRCQQKLLEELPPEGSIAQTEPEIPETDHDIINSDQTS
ncbi:MAG: hypothetical protein K0U68_14995 [Gammaproteobacteria bacterium]|nr:hypothetical protein [Gammaproteobacteria bacterium]